MQVGNEEVNLESNPFGDSDLEDTPNVVKPKKSVKVCISQYLIINLSD